MYKPNFNDVRVLRRVKNAVGFTSALTSNKPRQLSTRWIDKHFGSNRNPLSKYLRETLLVTDHEYDKRQNVCKKYITNKTGLLFLLDVLDKKNNNKHIPNAAASVVDLFKIANDWVSSTYNEQLDSLDFEYEDKSHRLCNPMQNIPSAMRCLMLAEKGLKFDYDISTAAPTLLYQHSFQTPSATGECLFWLEHYLKNKSAIRNKIAVEAELPVENIKNIINAMFSGGFLTTYKKSQVFKMCNSDTSVVRFLQQHEFLNFLKADIKTMWAPIKADQPVEYYWTKTQKWWKKSFSPKDKWNIYFKLERKVLNEIRIYLDVRNIKYFLEHDGFRTNTRVDILDLSEYIYKELGFELIFKEVLH